MFDSMSEETISSLGLGIVAMEARGLKILSEEYGRHAREDNPMEEYKSNKTPEQLRAELIEQLKSQGGQIIDEIAMPGVIQPVNTDA